MSSHPKVSLKPFQQHGSKLPTYPHVIKRNSNLLTEVFTEQWDLGVPLTEVIEHDELCVHLHPGLNRLGGCAAKRTGTQHRAPWSHTDWPVVPLQRGRAGCLASEVTSHQRPTLHMIPHSLGTRCVLGLCRHTQAPLPLPTCTDGKSLTFKHLQESSCNYLELCI